MRLGGARRGAWEESRYDALGRRILVRSRPGTGDAWYALCTGSTTDCPAYVERTVWDGQQVLYELRTNGADDRTNAQLDWLWDTGPHWGKVGYVHVGGIDRPVLTLDGRVPTYNWRGLAESSVWLDGTPADCSLTTGACTTIAWPSGASIYRKVPPRADSPPVPPQWVGTVLADGAGSTGLLNRRARAYDPVTGQFTQQDPIGIAGGANVYGFAAGDPINFDDPFGLCPPPCASDDPWGSLYDALRLRSLGVPFRAEPAPVEQSIDVQMGPVGISFGRDATSVSLTTGMEVSVSLTTRKSYARAPEAISAELSIGQGVIVGIGGGLTKDGQMKSTSFRVGLGVDLSPIADKQGIPVPDVFKVLSKLSVPVREKHGEESTSPRPR